MKTLQSAISSFDENRHDILFDIMNLFKWHIENYRVTWFDFWEDYDKTPEESCPFKFLRIKSAFFQIREIEEMQIYLEWIFNSYIDENFVAPEFCLDDEWLYIEVLFDEFK